jgi:hypothetical protein
MHFPYAIPEMGILHVLCRADDVGSRWRGRWPDPARRRDLPLARRMLYAPSDRYIRHFWLQRAKALKHGRRIRSLRPKARDQCVTATVF